MLTKLSLARHNGFVLPTKVLVIVVIQSRGGPWRTASPPKGVHEPALRRAAKLDGKLQSVQTHHH
jgi:hypothetical protein